MIILNCTDNIFYNRDGIVYRLVIIDEDDFNVEKEGQIEIIGWLYQLL